MTGRLFFRSRPWRAFRWAGLALAVPALWACNTRTLEMPKLNPTSDTSKVFQETLNRKIDVLFMIDDSSSMETAQTNLTKNLPVFMNVLKGLPGGLPDLHIAVVTSDLGATDTVDNCAGDGDGGRFQSAAHSAVGLPACTDTTLMNGAHYIVDTGGANPQTNFSAPDITTVFQCIAPVGASGCGFEHQLASVARALGADGASPPQENQGFLRDDAYLAIILITNEDDCSAPPGSPLFDTTTNNNLASHYGPPGNFLCNEWGHLCGTPPTKPSRQAPNNMLTDTVTYSPANGPDTCQSQEGPGVSPTLIPVSAAGGFADQIKGLKADPNSQILVAAIAGPTVPYIVHWKNPDMQDTGPWPEVSHSCGSPTSPGSFADPGVRIQQFVKEFHGNGLVYPFCSTDYSPALNTIATKLSALIGPKCVTGTIAKRPNSQTYDCTVTDIVKDASGNTIQTVVPACDDNNNMANCWALTVPAMGQNCPAGTHVVAINRGGTMPPDGLSNAVDCAKCVDGFPNAATGCP